MLPTKFDIKVLALDEQNGIAILQDGVIDLFVLFSAEISRVFGDYLRRVVDVVAQFLDEGKDQ
jgi:hypothetical protein